MGKPLFNRVDMPPLEAVALLDRILASLPFDRQGNINVMSALQVLQELAEAAQPSEKKHPEDGGK